MQTSALYADFGAIADLRQRAVASENATLGEAAAHFESLFVQMMLKSMRDATIEGGLFSSHQLETYQQMHDQQLSLEMAAGGGLGLAEMIVQQMQGPAATGDDANTLLGSGEEFSIDSAADAVPITVSDIQRYLRNRLPSVTVTRAEQPAAAAAAAPGAAARGQEFSAATPAEFVQQLQPLARAAAQKLGVQPEVLIAQAALETGWGQRMSADFRGPSLNLFNIKAGGQWLGRTVNVSTVEFRDGVARRENASFRAYDSLEDSFNDYVDLISGSPRYQQALQNAADPHSYLGELQQAGYATDPAYADKVLNILQRADAIGQFSG